MNMLKEMQSNFIKDISNKLDELIKKELINSLYVLGYQFFDDENLITFIKARVTKNESYGKITFYLDKKSKLFSIEFSSDFSTNENTVKYISNYRITH